VKRTNARKALKKSVRIAKKEAVSIQRSVNQEGVLVAPLSQKVEYLSGGTRPLLEPRHGKGRGEGELWVKHFGAEPRRAVFAKQLKISPPNIFQQGRGQPRKAGGEDQLVDAPGNC